MTLAALFGEIRLQSGANCRAWTSDHGCYSALEWEFQRGRLPRLRQPFERARLRISEALSTEGIDPQGITRSLLIHESAAPLSRAELRAVGFVHLESASGIHLYALWGGWDAFLGRLAPRFRRYPKSISAIRAGVPVVLGLIVFGLTGFRPGLVRALVLVGVRWSAARFGFRWSKFAPILIALAVDAAFAFLASFGKPQVFTDWAPGELHYLAAWGGGMFGYDFARERGWGSFRAHVALSIAAWVAVLPFDLAAGMFAPATPLLSLLTVEFFVRGGYLALFGGALAVGLGSSAAVREGLEGASFFVSRGVSLISAVIIAAGGARNVSGDVAGILAAFVSLWVISALLRRFMS